MDKDQVSICRDSPRWAAERNDARFLRASGIQDVVVEVRADVAQTPRARELLIVPRR
jgi:hypothetical protein